MGGADLVISNVQVLFGSSDFFVLSTPATPVTVEPGEEITFTVAYTATVSAAVATALIRITSNDLGAPFVDLLAFGGKGKGKLATAIADFVNCWLFAVSLTIGLTFSQRLKSEPR